MAGAESPGEVLDTASYRDLNHFLNDKGRLSNCCLTNWSKFDAIRGNFRKSKTYLVSEHEQGIIVSIFFNVESAQTFVKQNSDFEYDSIYTASPSPIEF